MSYYYKSGVIVPFVQKFYKQMILVVTGLFIASMSVMTLSANALSMPVNGCTFIQNGNKWKLTANCTATAQINLPAGARLDGKNKTIKAGFQNPSNDPTNNSLIGVINVDDVQIKDLVLDGTGGSKMYGINTYQSQDVNLKDVTIKNSTKYGLGVNGSEVTVKDITTSNNSWGGINVDQGSGVTLPSVLTVKGTSHHTELANIYVDDMTKLVQVNDARNQYNFINPAGAPQFDRVYVLKPVVNNHHDDHDEEF